MFVLRYVTKSMFLLLLLLCLFMFSCTPQPSPEPVDKPSHDGRRYGYPVEQLKQANACYDIVIEYPFFARPQLDQQVLLWVDAQNYSSMQELLAICAETTSGSRFQPYQHKVDYELFTTAHSVSVMFKSWSYLGGAHGINNLHPLNLNVENGDELHYSDLFANTNGLYTFLSDYVYSQLYPKMADIWQSSPMFTEGLEPVEGSFKNFAITKTGLLLYFPPYQIAPHSEGTLSCEIPLAALLQFKPKPGIWQ